MCIRDSLKLRKNNSITNETNITAKPKSNTTELTAAIVLSCLLYTSDAADERSSVDLGGRRIIKKKNSQKQSGVSNYKSRNKQKKHTR